jgi:molybdenum cofactor cytidylyltransferase
MRTNKPIALILAAGTSDRMGRLKAFLPFDEHRAFLQKIVDAFLTFGCPEVRVVLNAAGMDQVKGMLFSEPVRFVLNQHPEKERFYSLQTGLKAVPENTPVMLHNGDNPMIEAAVLNHLWAAYREDAVTVPVYQNKGGHPVILAPGIVKAILKEPDEQTHLKTFLQQFPQNRVPVQHEGVLTNINTPEAYEKHFGKPLK